VNALPDRLFAAIPAAASNPLALVAYVLAVGAWLVIAWRVRRNRQLLTILKVIPPRERAQLLELEMGAARLAAGLDAESWLRARRHMYYLIAFIVACVAAVVVAAIAQWSAGSRVLPSPSSDTSTAVAAEPQVIYSGSASHSNQLDILAYVKPGVSRHFIEYHAGPPQIELSGYQTEHGDVGHRVGYAFPKYYLVLVYDAAGYVVQYGVTIRDRSVRVAFPWPGTIAGRDAFAAIGSGTPVYFNSSAREWVYIENIWYAGDLQNRAGLIGYTDYGADFTGNSDVTVASDLLPKMMGSSREQLTATETKTLREFRQHIRPNFYGETTTGVPELRPEDVIVDNDLNRLLSGQ